MRGIDALRESLAKDIERFDIDSTRHKRLHRRTETIAIVLTAATTVLAGVGLIVSDSSTKYVQFGVLCLTACTAAVGAWSQMRHARELWQHEREVHYALLDIQRAMEFAAANRELTQAELETIFEKISSVLGASAQKWTQIQDKESKQVAQPALAAVPPKSSSSH